MILRRSELDQALEAWASAASEKLCRHEPGSRCNDDDFGNRCAVIATAQNQSRDILRTPKFSSDSLMGDTLYAEFALAGFLRSPTCEEWRMPANAG